jgi:hypothetical protein
MSLTSWNRRLRAIEQRPTAQRPLRIVGGLPSGAEMLQAMCRAPTPICEPLAKAEHEEPAPAPAALDSGRINQET